MRDDHYLKNLLYGEKSKILLFRFYFLFMRDTHNDVGLDPETPGSCPEPNADTQPLSHPGIPELNSLLQYL